MKRKLFLTLFFFILANTYAFFDFNTHSSYLTPISEKASHKNKLEENLAKIDSTTLSSIEKAKAIFAEIENKKKYIDSLIPIDTLSFPVGIKRSINNVTYTVGFSTAKFYPTYTELTAFVRISLPQTDSDGKQKELFFGADDIKISREGGINQSANIVLLGDYSIPLNGGKEVLVLKGGMDMESGEIENKTFVTIDCGGFKELGIEADVVFSKDLIQPVDSNYKVILDSQVKGHFSTKASGWNDILANISLPPFQVTQQNSTEGKGGLIFKLTDAVFDFSDLRNDPSVHFPQEYEQYLVEGNHELWQGVYIKGLEVVLPSEFKKRGQDQRVQFLAENVLIDGMGLTGDFSVDNILPIHEGNASKWQFSVEHFEISFLANQITSGGFNGKIVLPVTKEISQSEANDSTVVKKRSLSYDAIVDLNNETYNLNVSPADTLSFDIFKAKATLFPNSYIQLKVSDHKFKPKAVLNGNIDIAANKNPNKPDKKTLQFNGIEFQNMIIRTDSTKFSVDYLGYNGSIKIAGFPVTLSDISVNVEDETAALNFNLAINMMSNGFVGKTSLSIISRKKEINELDRWQFHHVDMEDIALHADLGPIILNGMLQIKEDDPVYGDGFYGSIGADFSKIKVNASAWFGKTTFRYWYVDAFADLRNAYPHVKLGPIDVIGFGGGAYYRMKKTTGTNTSIPSGLDYQPDNNSGLGFRAMLGYAFQEEKAVNGRMAFEMAFNNHGGVNNILYYGSAHIMQTPDQFDENKFKQKTKQLETNPASTNYNDILANSKNRFPHEEGSFDKGINAYLGMEMDFVNNSFHASLETYVNTAGLKGYNNNNLAGMAILHFDPSSWYLHLGTPNQRIGLKLGIGSANIKTSSYLMIGDNIPAMPLPDERVLRILNLNSNDFNNRDISLLSTGRGFALGMNLGVDTGDLTFLMFYAHFTAGVGFDIMIKDFGETACQGSGQIGIDGWYASGQAYAFLEGKLGIKIKLLGIKKKVTILSGSAAVLLQSKLPNPSWFRGYVGGDYNVLGIIKGHYRFKIEFGEKCQVINGNPLGGLEIISQISPREGSNQIDVFTKPQVAFNLKINEPFNLEDDDGDNHTYRILLDKFTLTQNGKNIDGHLEWLSNDVVNFVSTDVLPQNESLEAEVKVIFQEKQNNTWHTIMQNGQPAIETKTTNFTTGDAPDYIPLTNVEYCYPIVNQKYVYKDESNTGYIKLIQGQPYLFSPQTDWTQKIKLTGPNGEQVSNQVSYDTIQRMIYFALPPMMNQQSYNLRLVSISPEQAVSENQTTYTTQNLGDNNTVEMKNVEAQNVVKSEAETEIISYDFNTSEYNTFADKINAKMLITGYSSTIYPNVELLHVLVEETEAFDKIELLGNEYTSNESLITIETILDDSYFFNDINPLVYNDYPIQGVVTVSRDTTQLGVPPIRGKEFYSYYIDYLETNPNSNFLKKRMPFVYNQPFYYYNDFIEIRDKLTTTFSNNPNILNQYNYIIQGNFHRIPTGYYKMRYSYVMPGGVRGSSTIFKYYRQ